MQLNGDLDYKENMWTELLKIDDFSSFITTQKCCAEHYKDFDQSTINWCFEHREKFRVFHYDDNDYEINLATNLEGPTTARAAIIGIGKCLDLTTAIDIVIIKMKEIMAEYGVNGATATWEDTNPELVNSFYFGFANTFVSQSVSGSVGNPRKHVYTADATLY